MGFQSSNWRGAISAIPWDLADCEFPFASELDLRWPTIQGPLSVLEYHLQLDLVECTWSSGWQRWWPTWIPHLKQIGGKPFYNSIIFFILFHLSNLSTHIVLLKDTNPLPLPAGRTPPGTLDPCRLLWCESRPAAGGGLSEVCLHLLILCPFLVGCLVSLLSDWRPKKQTTSLWTLGGIQNDYWKFIEGKCCWFDLTHPNCCYILTERSTCSWSVHDLQSKEPCLDPLAHRLKSPQESPQWPSADNRPTATTKHTWAQLLHVRSIFDL